MSFLLRIFIFFALLFCAPLVQTPPAWAAPQTSTPPISANVLTDELGKNFMADGSIFVLEDSKRSLGFNSIIAMIQNGQIKAFHHNKSVIGLGSKGDPFWVVIPILNKSSQEVWTLDLGSASSGRIGFADKAILYESTSRQTIFNTTVNEKASTKSNFLSSKVPLKLQQGTTSYLIFYIEGRKGSLTSFKPSFSPAINMQPGFGSFIPQSKTFFLVSILVLLTGFLFKQDYSFISLSVMWLVFFLYRDLIDHVFVVDNFIGQILSQSFRLLYPLFLLSSLWLTSGAKQKYPFALFVGSGILFIMCGFMGMLLPAIAPNVGILLSYAPPIGICFLLCFLTSPFVSMRYGNSFSGLAVLSGTLLFTNLWALLETLGAISTIDVMTHVVPWIMSFVAPIASILQVYFSKNVTFYEYEEETGDLSSDKHIREARESAELKRLLEVLDQERSLMKNLQLQEILQTEEMKKAKESADEANIAKSAFLAVVSHEIRTPMTGIMGMVRLMLDTGLSRDQREYANTIQDSGEALLSLLNDILDFEKIESGRLELEEVNFDLKRLLRGVHTLMNGHAASKNVELILQEDEKLPNFVVGDPTRLRQVLLNLVNNAIKFTSRGNVTIQVKNLADVASGSEVIKQIYFSVQDSGIGISPEAQKKIFTPFSQADASINRKFGGTGLGLTICKRLIEAMGSSISINSREGEGSTFFFTLSMRAAEAEDKALRPTTGFNDYSGKKLNVLVVDDNGINQKVLLGLLGKTGHQTAIASNANEAVELASMYPFDVILMDIELPGKSGIDAMNEIRALPDSNRAFVPIVAMTGNVGDENIRKYYASGMNDFLGKPVMPETLQQIIAKVIKGEFANPIKRPASAFMEAPPSLAIPMHNMESFIQVGSVQSPTDQDDDDDSFATAVREFEKAEQKPADQSLSTPSNTSLLDQTLINSLVNSLGIPQTQELVKDFYTKTEELIADIKKSFEEKDPVAIKARAHELKGMAANFGFKTLSEKAGIIEKDVMNAKEAELRPLLETLSGLFDGSRIEMDQKLQS